MDPMSVSFILVGASFAVTFVASLAWTHRYYNGADFRLSVSIAGAVSLLCLMMWLPLAPSQPLARAQQEPEQTLEEAIAHVQEKLREDPNDALAWFELGQGYLARNEFESAATCFDYTIRLSSQPAAAHYSAKASAEYYLARQQVTPQVRSLLDRALKINPVDRTALTLLASDHYISFRYKQAIRVWEQLLDSKQKNLDRAAIIRSINQARERLELKEG